MSLPSKKQQNKHKRGTRKALDTLEALEKAESGGNETAENTDSDAPEQHHVSDEMTFPKKETGIKKTEAVEAEAAKQKTVLHDPKPEMTENQASEADISRKPLEKMTSPAEKVVETVAENKDENPMTEHIDKLQNDLNSLEEEKSSVQTSFMADDDDDENDEDTQKDKYLTFRIEKEIYGIAIRYVTEIIVIQRITEVPDTPPIVRGVINLRGKVIPVIDVRIRFDMETREYDERTCIIVVEYNDVFVGLIVDTVNEVVDIPEENVEPPPRTHGGIESGFIEGMGKIGHQVIIILDLERVLFVDELLAKQRDLED